MDLMQIIREFQTEGFDFAPLSPGFITGKRRKSPRMMTYRVEHQSIALHDTFQGVTMCEVGDLLRFEVVCS